MKALLTILEVWRPQRWRLLAGFGIAVLSALAALLLMGQTGSRLGSAALGVGMGFVLLRLSGVGRIVLRYFERLATHDAMFRALADLRLWFYERLALGSAAGLGFRRSGDLVTRLVQDVQSLDGLYLRVLVPFGVALVSFPVLIWICAQLSVGLACLVGGLFLLMVCVLPVLAGMENWKRGGALLTAQGNLQADVLDLAAGLREIRMFGAEERFTAQLLGQQEQLYALQARQSRKLELLHAFTGGLESLGILAVLLAGVGVLCAQPSPLQTIITLFVCLTLLGSVRELPRAGALAAQAMQAGKRIVTVAEQPDLVPQGTVPAPQNYDLRFENVRFGWVPGQVVLEDVSVHVPEGTRVALIGPSGAGKSSLAALILKVVVPEQGRITLGGENLLHIEEESLRHRVGWLSQNTHLFADTIRNNLLLGREDVPESALWEALEQAQLAAFVRGLPDGLETWIGENGSRLSGGQGRRLALARVLLSDASILILDEPTSGLDEETAHAFLQTLNALERRDEKRSVVLILHALTGIEELDQVWTLEKGQLHVAGLGQGF